MINNNKLIRARKTMCKVEINVYMIVYDIFKRKC